VRVGKKKEEGRQLDHIGKDGNLAKEKPVEDSLTGSLSQRKGYLGECSNRRKRAIGEWQPKMKG